MMVCFTRAALQMFWFTSGSWSQSASQRYASARYGQLFRHHFFFFIVVFQQSMGRGNDNRVYIIEALWDPNAHNFEVLNTETPRG
jgi:hypothetical protein